MKKKTLLNAIIITLLIIMGVSIVIAAFMLVGEIRGFVSIGIVSFVYIMIILLMGMKND